MKKLMFLVLISLCAMPQLRAEKIKASVTLPNEGAPEYVYTMSNGNGLYANDLTAPTQTAGNYGMFAFYAVSGVDNAYYIYSKNANKWLSYTPATSYGNRINFIELSNTRNTNAYFKFNNFSSDKYEISPYTTSGTINKYLNWYQGLDSNPCDGATTLGLWQDNGSTDLGSSWIFTEVTLPERTYAICIPDGYTITIGNQSYANGDTYTIVGSVTRGEIGVSAPEGKFAIVSIDDVQETITVYFVTLPTQANSATYTQAVLYPKQQELVGAAQSSVQDTVYTLSNNVLAASFIKVGNSIFFAGSKAMNLMGGTEIFSVSFGNGDNVYASGMRLNSVEMQELQGDANAIGGVEHFAGKQLVANYDYIYKDSTINIVWRAVLRDGSHYLRTEMELKGMNEIDMYNVIPLMYNVDVATAGSTPEVIGNTRGAVLMSDKIFAGLETPMGYNTVTADETGVVAMQGRWSRNTMLKKDETWKIAAVVGLVAQDGKQADENIHKTQKRRSFLAYSERERAVPWRANPVYISWYELTIDRNNAANPADNMNVEQVLDVISHWKTDLYNRYGVGPNSFVIDDGWDNYGTWTFHDGFPNEMRDMANLAQEIGAGVGAWLGPVGGYGTSGDYRRAYWNQNGRGGLSLTNPAYYTVFKDAAKNLTQNQGNFNFFKFDGISAQVSSVGPDPGDQGNENAEGIIGIERYVREELRSDIFLNTTVGTWASPFWYQFTDATWRQDQDYGEVANSNTIDRERWITYRDLLVYQNYVSASPICPINTLMTHGFILTRFGDVSKNMDYEAVRRELRCAFACGSGMVELYNDYALMNSINNGKLWADLAECIKWQKRNADVLPDIHWVGGSPWEANQTNVYGWAAWNGTKSTLALRNGGDNAKNYTFTLREALNIPANVTGSIILRSSFGEQEQLTGLIEGVAINIDTQLTVSLPGSSVYCFDGIDASATVEQVKSITLNAENANPSVELGKTMVVTATINPTKATFPALSWSSSNPNVATVSEGLVNTHQEGGAVITATAKDGSGVTASITITVTPRESVAPVEYCTYSGNSTHTERYLNSLTISGGVSSFTINSIQGAVKKAIYHDKTSQIFEVVAGSEVTPIADWAGSWMHGYLYIDYNKNGVFSDDATEGNFVPFNAHRTGSELASFTYYQSLNSAGAGVEGSVGPRNLPAFTIPSSTPMGEYRARYVVAWNSVDPCGYDNIQAHGGCIVDFTMKVLSAPSAINKIEGDDVFYYANGKIYTHIKGEIAVYDLSGKLVKRALQAPVSVTDLAHGAYIVQSNGRSMKFVK